MSGTAWNAAVVVAAGRGIRIGGDVPKQYRSVGGRAVLTRTLAALAAHPDLAVIQPVIAADAASFYHACVDGSRRRSSGTSSRRSRRPAAPPASNRSAPDLRPWTQSRWKRAHRISSSFTTPRVRTWMWP